MFSCIRQNELENLIGVMIQEGDDPADIIATVKDTIIQTQLALSPDFDPDK